MNNYFNKNFMNFKNKDVFNYLINLKETEEVNKLMGLKNPLVLINL